MVNDVSLCVGVEEVIKEARSADDTALRKYAYRLNELYKQYEYDFYELLTGTIGGQHILEYFVCQYLSNKPLSLPSPDGCGEKNNVRLSVLLEDEEDEEYDCGKWRVGEFSEYDLFDGDVISVILEHIDDTAEKYVYVLRWVNENKEVYYYVGDTINLSNRMEQHIRCDGDFTAAKRSEKNRLLSVEEIIPESKMTEKEKYNELVSEFGKSKVFGGR